MLFKLIKEKLLNNSQRLINSVTLATLALICSSQPSQAEGSRSLFPSGATGNRANIEWRNSNYANIIKRRTLLQVYVNRGEYILLGSSAVGVNSGDIKVYNPGLVTGTVGQKILPSSASFSCSAQRTTTTNAAQGRIYATTTPNITARQRELAGPDTITNAATATPGNAVTNGYVPCFYQAPQTGIYNVVFYGPTGDNSDAETAPTGDINNVQTDAAQNTSIAAWDVTVRGSLTSTTDINGRLFSDYLALFTGANNRPVNSKLFIVTIDGFKYLTNLNGVDPNGFVTLANDVGFYDSDRQTPLYHNLVDDANNQLTAPQGGVTLSLPKHLIFFTDNTLYQPDSAAITENNIPTIPTAPTISNLTYTGSAGSNDSYVGVGGTFSYSTNVAGNYQIIISRNGTDFDPSNPQNRVLRGVRTYSGTQTVTWDGLDNEGKAFPKGTGYQVRASVQAGEYHFPLLDAENSINGGPSYTLVNPPATCPGVAGCSTAYYDDRGYRTLNGSTVGTVNTLLPNGNHPGAASSLTGFNSTSNQRRFSNDFGDKRGLDLWTYFPSTTASVLLNIIDSVQRDLQITKTHSGDLKVGQNGVYTLTVKNVGTRDFAGTGTNFLRVIDTLPSGLSYVSATSTTTGWNCSATGSDSYLYQ